MVNTRALKMSKLIPYSVEVTTQNIIDALSNPQFHKKSFTNTPISISAAAQPQKGSQVSGRTKLHAFDDPDFIDDDSITGRVALDP